MKMCVSFGRRKDFFQQFLLPPLPEVKKDNLKECWKLLNSYKFICGRLHSVIMVSTERYKAWRISFYTTEPVVHNYPKRLPYPGFVPCVKKSHFRVFKHYFKNIIPVNFSVGQSAYCKFTNLRDEIRRVWMVDLKWSPKSITKTLREMEEELESDQRRLKGLPKNDIKSSPPELDGEARAKKTRKRKLDESSCFEIHSKKPQDSVGLNKRKRN